MMREIRRILALVSLLPMLLIVIQGCEQKAPPVQSKDKQAATTKPAHTHGEWWCDEHGVPEDVCTRCKPRLAKDFKAKDDWCAKHNRPDSQCFICHPEYEEKFAALYEAKYGKKPPKPEAE